MASEYRSVIAMLVLSSLFATLCSWLALQPKHTRRRRHHQRRSTAAAAARNINRRFTDGEPTSDLSDAGVILHAFDAHEDPHQRWRMCSEASGVYGGPRGLRCWPLTSGIDDRLSCSLASASGQRRPYTGDGGLVIAPAAARLLCSYSSDGSTDDRRCSRLGAGGGEASAAASCVPGCHRKGLDGGPHWCDAGSVDAGDCAWRPDDLAQMLRAPSTSAYNEVVLEYVAVGASRPPPTHSPSRRSRRIELAHAGTRPSKRTCRMRSRPFTTTPPWAPACGCARRGGAS